MQHKEIPVLKIPSSQMQVEKQELTDFQKLKMINFTEFINSSKKFGFMYIEMLERNYPEILEECQKMRKCQYCSKEFTEKQYAAHFRHHHMGVKGRNGEGKENEENHDKDGDKDDIMKYLETFE